MQFANGSLYWRARVPGDGSKGRADQASSVTVELAPIKMIAQSLGQGRSCLEHAGPADVRLLCALPKGIRCCFFWFVGLLAKKSQLFIYW
jgi:hypothetical protein